MTVIATSAVPDRLRSALSRWFIEVAPGLYVGTVSARVRDEVWSLVIGVIGDGAAVLAYPDSTEQGFSLRTAGTQRRETVDFDGLTLVRMPPLDLAEAATVWPDGW
jgi:CRISPR-associated protein Cas2